MHMIRIHAQLVIFCEHVLSFLPFSPSMPLEGSSALTGYGEPSRLSKRPRPLFGE